MEICEKSAVDLTLFEFQDLFLVSRKGEQKKNGKEGDSYACRIFKEVEKFP